MTQGSHMSPHASERPLVSVVIGVLNGARTLERCIDSVVQQTLPRRELIVQDGGSTDATVEILQRRTADIAHWTSEPDRGLYDAWNRALAHCRGEYICFLGCDDELADPFTLERLAPFMTRPEPPDLVCSLAAHTDARGRFVKTLGRAWDWAGMKRSQVIAHPGMLHHASLFARHGTFDQDYRIAGDYEFLLRLGPATRAVFVDQITVRMGANGMSHRLARRTFREIWQAQARHPEIGMGIATRNYGANLARFAVKNMKKRLRG